MIDTSFDFRTDAGGGDPDKTSPTLRRYHQELWSKPLPSGGLLSLVQTTPYVYLHHQSALGEFFLSSDAVIPDYTRYQRMKDITDQLTDGEGEAFIAIGYTIGGMMVFPGNQIDRRWTINQARGCLAKIRDRLDLTLECIRLHYEGQPSPMDAVLARYTDFFELFGDFAGYVDFFHLQDLITDDGEAVKFFIPGGFNVPSLPQDLAAYREYKNRSIEFVQARNQRIDQLAI